MELFMEMDPTKHMNRMKQTLNSVERLESTCSKERLKSNDKYKDKKTNN